MKPKEWQLFGLFVLAPFLIFESSALGQDWEKMLELVSRQQQTYKVSFAARPDRDRFQIRRIPSAKWPKRSNFYLKVGDTSVDGQIRIDKFVEKEAKTETGILVDASELTVTFLESGEQHILVRNVDVEIPTYFAELRIPSNAEKRMYVKEGEKFKIEKHPETDLLLKEVKEDSAVIHVLDAEGKVAEAVNLKKAE